MLFNLLREAKKYRKSPSSSSSCVFSVASETTGRSPMLQTLRWKVCDPSFMHPFCFTPLILYVVFRVGDGVGIRVCALSCVAWARHGRCEMGATCWPLKTRLLKKRRLLLDLAGSRRMLQKDKDVVARVPAGGGDGGCGSGREGVACGDGVVVN